MVDDILLHYGTTGETNLHPIALAAILVASFLIFTQNRKKVLIPVLFVGILIPMNQRVVIAGIDLMIIRILIFVTCVRIILTYQKHSIKLNSIDKVLILWVVSNVVTFSLLWQTSGAVINRLGFAYDSLGLYFIFRYFISDIEDVKQLTSTVTLIAIIISIAMVSEQFTGRNIFSVFGGVPEFSQIREGRLRSQAAFGHPILAGTFGASLFPLILSQWWNEKSKKAIILIGLLSVTVITITSASSGPIIALLAGIVGLCMWPFRNHMRKIRWGILFTLIGLHLSMKAPVWSLIGRTGTIGGSSAYHRFRLVDQFIKRMNEWFLLGTKSTGHWGWMMWDDSNYYVSQGTTGGLLTLVLFIVIITLCFRSIGLNLKAVKNNSKMRYILWAVGASLFVHSVAFFGISYFDQIILIWYLLLAIIASIKNLSDSTVHISGQNLKRV